MPASADVSVVIPVHNAGQFLAVQLTALVKQDYERPFEVVLVDNNSDDGAIEALDTALYSQLDLRVVRAHDGVGPAYARNAGARAAGGRFLLFCDADDAVNPDWVRKMVNFLATGGYDIVTSAVEGKTLNSSGRRKIAEIAPPDKFQSPQFFAPIVVGCSFGCTAHLYAALGGMDESYRANEEVEMGWRAFVAGYRVGYLPEALVAYRYRVGFRAGFRQGTVRGVGFARLGVDFPGSGIGNQSVTRLLAETVWIGTSRGLPAEERGLLIGIALGRIRGGFAYRTLRP